MDIQTDKYHVAYQPDQAAVFCSGSLMLNGVQAYESILELLKQAAEEQPESLDIDIRELKFLNSSGINMMTKFVMYVSDIKMLDLKITIVVYQQVAWQRKLAVNLQRLMPTLQIQADESSISAS